MDLPTVKAAVKAWEKAFRASHGRAPTKEDIKNDLSNISEQYAQYRRLVKAAGGPSSQSSQTRATTGTQQPSLASDATSSTRHENALAGPSTTPRTFVGADPPATPTPPARRTSTDLRRSHAEEKHSGQERSTYKSLKRTASKAALNHPHSSPPPLPPLLVTPSKDRSQISTPRKAYSGPVHDPNPVNPFAVSSPAKSSASVISSPFIHASSPRKLKEVLEMNSLRKVQERARATPVKGITPRTRARKRLKGEVVDDTPQKEPRRQRGQRTGQNGADNSAKPLAYKSEDASSDDDFGPSPFKAATPSRQARRFTSLLEPDRQDTIEAGPSSGDEVDRYTRPPNEMLRLFTKAVKADGDQEQAAHASSPQADLAASANAGTSSIAGDLSETLVELGAESVVSASESTVAEEVTPGDKPTISLDSGLRSEGKQSSRQAASRPVKMLSISDGEEDEWDPEGGHVQHRVAIVPTRARRHRRNRSSGSALSDSSAASPDAPSQEDGSSADEGDDGEPPNGPTLGDDKSGMPTQQKFAFLSLQSPTKKRKETIEVLRVQALFSSTAAARLRAIERGQEVYVSGEVANEDEIEGLETGVMPMDEAGDDDWESENEGWKAVVDEEHW